MLTSGIGRKARRKDRVVGERECSNIFRRQSRYSLNLLYLLQSTVSRMALHVPAHEAKLQLDLPSCPTKVVSDEGRVVLHACPHAVCVSYSCIQTANAKQLNLPFLHPQTHSLFLSVLFTVFLKIIYIYMIYIHCQNNSMKMNSQTSRCRT